MIMENFDNLIRCYPFSSVFYVGCKQCCNQMNLVSGVIVSCVKHVYCEEMHLQGWHQFFQPMNVQMNTLQSHHNLFGMSIQKFPRHLV